MPSRRKSELVLEQILRELATGSYRVGDLLPSEPRLAEAMGVSRASCRVAIAVLRLYGIVETHHGNGSLIKALPAWEDRATDWLNLLRSEPLDPFEVLAVRERIEPAVIGLAADSATEEQLAAVEEEILAMRDASAEDQEKCIYHNSWFHYNIMCATNNDVLVTVIQPLYYGITESLSDQGLWRKLLLETYHCSTDRCTDCLNAHQEILKALRSRDAERARESLKNHFTTMQRELLDSNASQEGGD